MADVAEYIAAAASFQVDYPASEVYAGPPAQPAVARLDTGETSPQTFRGSREEVDKSRRRKRGYHAELVRLLASMETGEHGLVAEMVGQRWLADVKKCPGVVRRHGPCGSASFLGSRCQFPLCPWCQARRSQRLREAIAPLVERMWKRKLYTFNPPNIERLTPGAIAALGSALTKLHRLAFLAGSVDKNGYPVRDRRVRGGIRAIEVTNKGHGWNLHAHEVLAAEWVAHYPQTDIEWEPGKRNGGAWKVINKHPGLSREFTRLCQAYPELAGLGYCLDGREHEGGHDYAGCPGCWYFVDQRRANIGIADEIAKYVVKGSQIVKAGPKAVVDYLLATKGKRLVQTFGNLYGVKLEVEEEEEAPTQPGQCPWPDCPEPELASWTFIGYGFPEKGHLEYDARTGLSRIRAGPLLVPG